jgi:small conductance mechanosensitive channel
LAIPAVPAATHAAATPSLATELQLIVVNGGLRLVVGVLILAVGWMLATWAKRGLEGGLARLPIDLTLKPLIASLARYSILILTALLVVQQFGVQTTSLIAVLGAVGLAIGLALQGTLSNVASGVMLLVLRPFRVGQFVEIAKGRQGTVREIGLFTTLIINRDGVYVSIPNSSIFGGDIINFTRERTRRITFTVPVDWVNDLELVERTIAATLTADARVLKEPAPTAVVYELQEYAVVMRAQAYVRSADYWQTLWSLQKEAKTALDKAQVLIAVSRQAAIIRSEPSVTGNTPPQAPNDDAPSGGA